MSITTENTFETKLVESPLKQIGYSEYRTAMISEVVTGKVKVIEN